jgi:hypothetical protein
MAAPPTPPPTPEPPNTPPVPPSPKTVEDHGILGGGDCGACCGGGPDFPAFDPPDEESEPEKLVTARPPAASDLMKSTWEPTVALDGGPGGNSEAGG